MRPGSQVSFGVYHFDLSTGELLREGVRVRLPAQPAHVLRLLIEANGQLVTRETLRESVWGPEVNVDFDKGLNFAISQIRGALRDSAESPRFILTVPKRGYQFIAPLCAAEPAAARGISRRSVIAASALAGAAAVSAGLLAWNRSRELPRLAVVRFDNETGDDSLARLTDGITDTLIVELTAATEGRLGIIGNAAILRSPRSRRDLDAIAQSLQVRYVILGQLKQNPGGIELLAHLLEMPKQTHRKVARFVPADAASAARRITETFLPLLPPSV